MAADRTINMTVNVEGDGTEKVKSSVTLLLEEIKKAKKEMEELADAEVVDEDALVEATKRYADLSASISDATKAISEQEGSMESLKQQFRDAQRLVQTLASQPIVDDDALQLAITRAADLRDQINDSNEQVGVLTAGSKWEMLSNSIGDVTGKLMSLDFEGAKESAERMIEIAKTISFKDAISSAKDLGKTMVSLGKAILTNPLFLIGAVLAALVVIIYKVLDSLGVIKKVFDAIGDAIGWVVQQLKDFADWIGIADFAGEEAAKNQIKRTENQIEANNRLANNRQSAFDREIKLAAALGQDTTKIEIKKQEDLKKTTLQRISDIKKIIAAEVTLANADGEYTQERKDRIKELSGQINDLVQDYKNADNDIKVINAKTSTKEKEDAEKDNAKKTAIAEKNKQERIKRSQERAAQEEQDRANDLAATRKLEDIKASMIIDQTERELEQNRLKYERLQADNLTNEKISNEKKLEFKKVYEEQQAIDEAKIKEDKKKRDEEAISKEKKDLEELNEFKKSLITNEFILRDMEITAQLDKEKAQAKAYFDAGAIDKKEYERQLTAIEAKAKEDRDELKAIDANATKEELQARLDAELISINDYNTKVREIEAKTKEQDLKDEAAKWGKKIDMAEQYSKMAGDLIGSLLTISENAGKQDEKSQKAAAKRRFNVEKALAVVSIGISTAKGIAAALEAGVASPAYIAFAAATGAASMIAVASKKFDGGESANAGGSVSVPSAPSDVNTTQASTPSFNLFGSGGSANNVSGANGGGPSTSNNNNNIGVTVSITEIEDTSKKVSKINENATL